MFSVLAFASTAAAYNATTTVESTAYVTLPCSSGQTVTYGSLTYTATEATTLTVEDCSCTAGPTGSAAPSGSAAPTPSAAESSESGPVLGNGAAAAKAGAVAAGAAAVAYLL